MNFKFYTPTQIRTAPSPISREPGVYVICSRSCALKFFGPPRRSSLTVPEAYRPIYIGSAANLQRRIKNHVGSNSVVSSFRGSLGVLIGDELGLTAAAAELGGCIWFEEEERLSDWIDQNCVFGVIEDPNPLALESHLIRGERPPLNIEFLKSTPEARQLLQARAAVRAVSRVHIQMHI